jgi:hypothetical protein
LVRGQAAAVVRQVERVEVRPLDLAGDLVLGLGLSQIGVSGEA